MLCGPDLNCGPEVAHPWVSHTYKMNQFVKKNYFLFLFGHGWKIFPKITLMNGKGYGRSQVHLE
jgi:hypothetical protein